MAVDLGELARRMLTDYDARTPGRSIGDPIGWTTDRAYALQAEVARLREQRGENIIGYKVGCTSRPIQSQLGVGEPIFGRLFDTECHPSGAHLSAARYANLAVEGELAARLSQDLRGGSLSVEDCRVAIAEVFPVIELHHYALPETWPPAEWLIVSNGLHAGFVLAEAETLCSGLWNHAQGIKIRINGVVIGCVETAAALIDPAESLRWLTGRLARFGSQLTKGQVILTGSPLGLYPVAAGSRIVVEAPPLGTSCAEIDP
jgi:2-keto-4-pentenoate hydratase